MPQFEEEFGSKQEDSPDVSGDDGEMDTTTGMFPDITTEFVETILQDISNEESSAESQATEAAMSDDNFLQRFPTVNFLPSTATCSSLPSPQKKLEKIRGPTNIAGYIIATDDACTPSQEETPDMLDTGTFKRPRDPSDGEIYNPSKKRRQVIDENHNEPADSSLAENALQPIFDNIVNREENVVPNEDFSDLEEGSTSEDTEVDTTAASEDMPFPDLEEGIDFDVENMLNQYNQGIRTACMGDKALQQYIIQRQEVLGCIKQLYNCLKNAPKGVVEDKDPDGLSVPLMPHQRQAMKWMKWREQQQPCSGGILADEMGLGKTFQMIALIVAVNNEKKAKLLAKNPNAYYQEEYDDAEDWGSLDYKDRYNGRTLVVCTPSLMEQWDREIMDKCKSKVLSSYIYHGVDNKLVSEGKLIKYDVVITTYNTITMEYKSFKEAKEDKDSRLFNIHWNRIVLDEAHIIRNHLGKICEAVCELKGKTKWAITGTPIQNKEGDFFPLLKYLNCSPFTELTMWNKWVNNKKALGNKRLIVITKTLMLRRTKQELVDKRVIKPLPKKHFNTIEVQLDKEEQIVYQKLLLYSQSFFMEYLKKKQEKEESKLFPKSYYSSNSLIAQQVPKKLSRMMRTLLRHHTHKMASDYLLVLITRLRQACCHPALIKGMLDKEDTDLDDVEGERDIQRMDTTILEYVNKIIDEDEDETNEECDDYDIDDNQARNLMTSDNPLFNDDRKSSKVRTILQTIQDILNIGEKIVVVSQWTSFLQVIGNNLARMPDAKFAVFSGKTKLADRQVMVDRLNDYDDKLNVLLLSLTAGAVGLNLVGANHLLLIDNHWNPQLELQAQDRLHRFGQHNDVHIYRFVCKDTIEDKIIELQGKKLKIASKVLEGKVAENLSIKDLATLFS